jgi:hypothetical protein
MARTKQTARCCYMGAKVPRKQLPSQIFARKSAPLHNLSSIPI